MERLRVLSLDARSSCRSPGSEGRSVLVEQPLQIRGGPRLQQRQAKKDARLLRVVFHRRHESELVVVELDVAADDAGRHPRGAHAHDAVLRLRGERLHGGRGQVAVADARDHDALGARRDRGIDERAVHVLVGHDDVHARQRGDAVERELGVGGVPADRSAVELDACRTRRCRSGRTAATGTSARPSCSSWSATTRRESSR